MDPVKAIERGPAIVETVKHAVRLAEEFRTGRKVEDPALDEAGGRGSVVAVRGTDRKLSRQLRRCLALAQVDRTELFAMRDPTRKAMTFHDLRATAITWCAVRGDDPLKIKQRAGHASFSTTEGYIREAENLREGFGEMFPPLPSSLLSAAKPIRRRVSASVSAFGSMPTAILAKNKRFQVEAPGIEPGSENDLIAHLRT
jgi:hypothetical protein